MYYAHKAATIAPPATAPSIPNITPVGAAPPLLVLLDWLSLALPVATFAPPLPVVFVPPVVFAPVPLVVPLPLVTALVLTTVAAVALPVIVPGPWLTVGVKYKLTAVWLGN